MGSDQMKSVDVQRATGLAAALHQQGKSRSAIVKAVAATTVPTYRAEEITDDYLSSVKTANGEVRKHILRYALTWMFLVVMVGFIAAVKGYGAEFVVTIPLLGTGLFLLFKLFRSRKSAL